MSVSEMIDAVIERETFRKNIYKMIPEGASRILDIGCGTGALLLRLMRDKGCSELYGIEMTPSLTGHLEGVLEKVWNINVESQFEALQEYTGYFDYIILHDVVEHLYDPWFTMGRIRNLLSDKGKMFIATPNIHYWELQYQIMSGKFPYGPGLWHTGHLRWYTPISLVELLLVANLSIQKICLEIPRQVDFSQLARMKEVTSIQIPPQEFPRQKQYPNTYSIHYDKDIRKYYPVFFAHKIIAECGKGEEVIKPEPMTYNCPKLQGLRTAFNLPYDVYSPPPMIPLIGDCW